MHLSFAQVEVIKQGTVYFIGAQAELCLFGPHMHDTQRASGKCYRQARQRVAGL